MATQHTERFLLAALEHEGWLRSQLRRWVRGADQVDELIQETYARLLRAGQSDVLVVRSIKGFALATARNASIDAFRQGHLPLGVDGVTTLFAEFEPSESDVESEANTDQELALLAAALANISKEARRVFTLRKIYGFSQKEIAKLLGISENTVERHVAKAARACARYLLDRPQVSREFSLWRFVRRRAGGGV
jgi:RNA polymerase sigma factor (sigma-70 family)